MSSNSVINEIPWSFVETTANLTNYSANGIVYRTDKVPDGFMALVRDANVIFTTTGGGVRFQKRHKSGGFTIFTGNFTSTTTGINAIVGAGDRVEVALASTGTGVIDILIHGVLVRTRAARELSLQQDPTHLLSQDGI